MAVPPPVVVLIPLRVGRLFGRIRRPGPLAIFYVLIPLRVGRLFGQSILKHRSG